MCRLFYAEEYAKLTDKQPAPQAKESALQTIQSILPKFEHSVIEFLSEWLVSLLVRAKNVLQSRSLHLSFMLLKDYWFRELYLSLKVTASIDRSRALLPISSPKTFLWHGMFSSSTCLSPRGWFHQYIIACVGKVSRMQAPTR